MTIKSSIPAVITAVINACTSAVAGQVDNISSSPVEVVDGELGPRVPNQFVQILGVSNGQQVWGSIGTQRRNETYTVHGMVRVYVGSDDQAYCRQRTADLFALVETAVDSDPQLGAVVNGSIQASVTDVRWGVTDSGGRAAELDFVLAVVTQLIAT